MRIASPLVLVVSALVASALVTFGCSSEVHDTRPLAQQQAIFGGVVDSDGSAHENVIFLTSNQGACSGTLVASNLVLTAWHCVAPSISEGIGCDATGVSQNGDHVGSDFTPSDLRVRTGVDPSGPSVARGQQILHAAGRSLCNRDVAFVVLDREVTGITPAKIRTNYLPVPGEHVTVVGYGITSEGGGGGGTRRRRDNVPVLGAGKDWNELLSSSEFQVGASGCSGDSGGPSLDSVSGAVLGVSSRVSNCNVGPLISMSLFGQDALVAQAFAAAGKSALLEGNTPPGPIKTKAAGEACSSGWECLGDICQRDDTPGECTKFCNLSGAPACPSGMLCMPSSFDVDGQDIGADLCVSIPDDGSCFSCRASSCRLRSQDCVRNSECAAISDCVAGCGEASCREACIASHPDGADYYQSLVGCSCLTECKDVCNDCPATGGAGGAGGGGAGGAGGGGAGGAGGSGGVAGAGGASAGAAGEPTGGSGGAGATAGGSAGAQPVDAGSTSGCAVGRGSSRGDTQAPFGLAALLLALGAALRRRRA